MTFKTITGDYSGYVLSGAYTGVVVRNTASLGNLQLPNGGYADIEGGHGKYAEIATGGVWLGVAGVIKNGGSIIGGVQDGATENGGTLTTSTITNLINGFISGFALGAETTTPGTIHNLGTVLATSEYGIGAYLHGGRLTNGSAAAPEALIKGHIGVTADGYKYVSGSTTHFTSGSITNFGTIEGVGVPSPGASSFGIFLDNNDVGRAPPPNTDNSITNEAGALIEGYVAIYADIAAGSPPLLATLTNAGVIEGVTVAVRNLSLSRIVNAASGTIMAGGDGIEAQIYMSLVNFGTIEGSLRPVDLRDGGSLENLGTIEGGQYAVDLSGGGRLINFGTIEGAQYSVDLTDGGSLTVEPGSSLIGEVLGGGGRLMLKENGGTINGFGAFSTGTITGAADMTFTHFSGIYVDDGDWTLSGDEALSESMFIYDRAATTTNTGVLSLAAQSARGVGAQLLMDGEVDNESSIETLGPGTVLRFNAKLTGGGLVELSNGAIGGSLVNVDNTIVGWGAEYAALYNRQAGLVEASGGVLTLSAAVRNNGLIEAATNAILAIYGYSVQQGPRGVLLDESGGHIRIDGAVIVGGEIISSVGGDCVVTGGGNEFQGVELKGLTKVVGASTLTLAGTLRNDGELALGRATAASEIVVASDGVSVSGRGDIALGNPAGAVITGVSSSAVLTNTNDRIVGLGELGDGRMTLVNASAGDIVGRGVGTLTIDTGTVTIVNEGHIDANVGSDVVVDSAVDNSGQLWAFAGTVTTLGSVTGSGEGRIATGTLLIGNSFAQNVSFDAGATGVLAFSDWGGFSGQISGFSKAGSNTIDLVDFTLIGATASFSGTSAGGVLTVTNGAQTAALDLEGDYLSSTFDLASDGDGGVVVTDPTAAKSGAPLAQAMASFPGGALLPTGVVTSHEGAPRMTATLAHG